MNILINGSGAVGLGLGASMLSQKADVSFYATGKTATAIKENGLERTGLFQHYSFTPDEYQVYEDYKDEVTHWYYGHFHKSQMQTINNTMFKLLNIGEIVRHYSDDNNTL